MKILSLLIFLVTLGFYGYSQDYSTITGTVINADSVLIPNAYVAIKNGTVQTSAQADENGDFEIKYIGKGDFKLFADNYGKDSTIYVHISLPNFKRLDLGKVILFESGDTTVTEYPPPTILRD